MVGKITEFIPFSGCVTIPFFTSFSIPFTVIQANQLFVEMELTGAETSLVPESQRTRANGAAHREKEATVGKN